MKLIIAGGRDFKFTARFIDQLIEHYFPSSDERYECWDFLEEIVSGACSGVDVAGENFASINDLKLKRFPADWDKHGKSAGPIRNREMADYADALLLIWDGKSRGSANMKSEMEKRGKKVYEIVMRGRE